MSLLVCLRGIDGLVLATDSRGTFGDPRGVTAQNDQIKKLYLANERVGILVAGAGDLGSTVVSGFLALPDIPSLGVTELTMALHGYARKQFTEWFELFAIKPAATDSRPARPDLNFIVAGFGLDHEPKIYRMSSSLDFAPMLHNYGFGVDGVAQYALYLLNRLYDPASVMGDLECLAAYIIAETASQDGKVGGAIQMATCTTHRSQILTVSAVEEIVVANLKRGKALKDSFSTRQGKGTSGSASLKMPYSVEEPSTTQDASSISNLAKDRGVTAAKPLKVLSHAIEKYSTPPDGSTIADGLTADASRGTRW